MQRTDIPDSRFVYKWEKRKVRAYWFAQKKLLMFSETDCRSIMNKKWDQNKHSKGALKTIEKHQKHGITFEKHIYYLPNPNDDDAIGVMNIDGIKALFEITPTIKNTPRTREEVFPKNQQLLFRKSLLSALTAFETAFENGDRSMVQDLGPNAAWPADMVFKDMFRPVGYVDESESESEDLPNEPPPSDQIDLSDHEETLSDVGHKRKADEKNELQNLELRTMQIALDRQQYAFEQEKLKAQEDKQDREKARKDKEKIVALKEAKLLEEKKVAEKQAKVAEKQAKVAEEQAKKTAAETRRIDFDLEQDQAVVAAREQPPPAAVPSSAQRIAQLFFTSTNTGAAAASAAPTPAKDTASTAAKRTSKCSSRAKDKSAHIKGQSTLSFPKQPRGVACERT